MTKIAFDPSFPVALESEIERLLAPFLFLVPFMRTIQVCLKGAGSDVEGEAAVRVLRRYHTAHLYIDPDFFHLTFQEKELTLLHEVMHIVTNDFTRVAHRLADILDDDKTKEMLVEELEDAEETLVDFLAWKFYTALGDVKVEDLR